MNKHRYNKLNLRPRTKSEAEKVAEKVKREALELTFLDYVRRAGFPEPQRQVRLVADRRWAFDFSWSGVAVEIQGGIYARTPGGHNRGKALEDSYDKINAAQMNGNIVFQFGPNHLTPKRIGHTLALVEAALKAKGVTW